MVTKPRVWAEIDIKAIQDNFLRIAKTVKPAKVMAVLKANAYGLGIDPIARALIEVGAFRIGVAELKEAMQIINTFQVPVQILGSIMNCEIPEIIKAGIICPITDYKTARIISTEACKQNKKATCHILIDTGMGRLGIPYMIALKEIKKILTLSNIYFEGIYSHFPNANDPHHLKTQEQISIFKDLLNNLPEYTFPLIHMANSDAINNFRDSYFNMVRPGINLYGVFDLHGRRTYNLKPTVSLKTRLIAKRNLPAGFTIGYGCTYTLSHDTIIGTIPAGYADGIPVSSSNSAQVLIAGKECPIIGRVSMDYITIDLNGSPDAELGDTVTIIGNSGKREITVEDWAKIKQSHPYDIICSLGNRVERLYKC